jgi:D-beta-D-heptose 7-phosphate kinase/D-beta-D-heptose 1-phosphate adenosyltransferase
MQRLDKIVLVTGGFDPIHSGHIDYFKSAKELGDLLIVGLNSDEWLTRKKGQPFMSFNERKYILENLSMIDSVIDFVDDDDSSKNAIYKLRNKFPNSHIIFANGGDRNKDNILEKKVTDSNLSFAFGVGGENKKNSSSWILNNWEHRIEKRQWGFYKILNDKKIYKVKELVIEPNKSLSMQKHFKRNEFWFILSGKCDVVTLYNDTKTIVTKKQNETYAVKSEVYHQLQNNYKENCHVLEVQYGTECVESDIERQDA